MEHKKKNPLFGCKYLLAAYQRKEVCLKEELLPQQKSK